MNEKDLAWKRFAKTGKVSDYMNYRRTLEAMAEFAEQEDFTDDFEYGRSRFNADERRGIGHDNNRFNP
ncbi:MAG: hypothetical protein K5917_02135 [Clostridiales bacterium]|nr:hypothetical protein [Clostridiales bacterium]